MKFTTKEKKKGLLIQGIYISKEKEKKKKKTCYEWDINS